MKKPFVFIITLSVFMPCWYLLSLSTDNDSAMNGKVVVNEKVVNNSLITHQNCDSCHTPEGEDFIVTNGVLAGQGFLYLKKQLTDLAKGVRTVENLKIVNHRISKEDVIKSADYFSEKKRYVNVSEGSVAGQLLYHNGDDNRQIPACMACHVKNGYGIPAATLPALSGQTPEYIIHQLESFRDGSRTNDVNDIMQKTAIRLTDEDISALALYITTLN